MHMTYTAHIEHCMELRVHSHHIYTTQEMTQEAEVNTHMAAYTDMTQRDKWLYTG